MESVIRFNEEYVLKISRRELELNAEEGLGFDLIRDDLQRVGIIDAAVIGSMYHYRVLFDSQEDLNLYRLSGNIEQQSILNTGETLYRMTQHG